MKTFLDVAPSERPQVMALGALADPNTGQLYVPPGKSLAHFSTWLPAQAGSHSALVPAAKPGLSLTEMLTRVSGVIKSAFAEPVWVRIEVSELRSGNGHIYISAVDRDENGNVLAKANAHIWSRQATALGNKFFKETGMPLADGIKLLVLARPVLKPQYGLSLEITDLDPSYTLGDMQAKLKRIREKIADMGIGNLNKQLRSPGDFFHVVVICPEGAAGEGDFKADADRLERADLCRFTYINAVFQGERAKDSLKDAFVAAYQRYQEAPYCALAVIRGGGATADLHWLNEYSLAGAVCKFPCPVFVGIGHERDKTILDEYAHRSLGTPSKVIGHITKTIANSAQCASDNWGLILKAAQAALLTADGKLKQRMLQVTAATERRIDQAAYNTETLYAGVRSDAQAQLDIAAERIDNAHGATVAAAQSALELADQNLAHLQTTVRERAKTALVHAEAQTQNAFDSITVAARRSIDGINEHIADQWNSITAGVTARAAQAQRDADRHMADVHHFAGRTLRLAQERSKELIGSILAHGTGPTLRRGFAVIKAGGVPVSSRTAAMQHHELEIEFRDGTVGATRKDNE